MKNNFLKITVICAVLFSCIQLNAQQERGKLFISILGGYSSAGGNFTKTEYANNTSGYAAKNGFNIQLHSGIYVTKNLAIGVAIGSRFFQPAGLQSLSDGYLDDFDVDSTTVTTTGGFINLNFMAGPTYTIPLGKLSLDVHLLAGLSTLRTPQMKVDLEDNTVATFYQNTSTGNGFGLQAGLGARYFFSKKVGVEFRVDYLTASPSVTIENQNRVVTAGRILNTYKEQIGGIGASLGVSLAF